MKWNTQWYNLYIGGVIFNIIQALCRYLNGWWPAISGGVKCGMLDFKVRSGPIIYNYLLTIFMMSKLNFKIFIRLHLLYLQ